MLNPLSPALDAYVLAHSQASDALLDELAVRTQAELKDPQMQVGAVEGALLELLAGLTGATRALEIGTFSGYSAIRLARGMGPAGRLITCDVDPVATTIAREFWDRAGLSSRIDLRLAPALETLRSLAAEGAALDLVFLDADKENYVNYWDAAVPLVRPGGLIIADNTLWSGRVLDPQQPADHGIVAFNARVAEDARVQAVMLGVRDGVTLARKLPDHTGASPA